MFRSLCLSLAAGLPLLAAGAARAQAPAEIKIGHLHASSGPYASISMPVYDGLKIWVDQTNAGGGIMVKPFDRKVPLRLISYDDQSNPGTAATLTDQLISQDKVDILMSDSGSVLTAVATPIARGHKLLLFDPTGTGAPFFSKDMASGGMALLVVEHLMGFLDTVTDRVVVMNAGREIFEGKLSAATKGPDVVRVFLGNSDAA